MKRLIILCLLTISSLQGKSDLKSHLKSGKEYGNNRLESTSKLSHQIHGNDFLSTEEKRSEFDAEEAKKSIDRGVVPETEETKFLNDENLLKNEQNTHFDQDEYLFKRSEEISKEHENAITTVRREEETDVVFKQCRRSGDPFTLSFEKSLSLDVTKKKISVKERTCKWHHKDKKYYWKSDAEEAKKKKVKKFKKDPTIKSFSVKIKDGGVISDYNLHSKWQHHNNTTECSKYKEVIVEKEEIVEENERWSASNPSAEDLSRTTQCTLVDRQCLDSSPKNINGQEVVRDCWKESLSFFCQYNLDPCPFLNNNHCQEMSRKCLQNTPFGCSLWEIDFKCFNKTIHTAHLSDDSEIVGMAEDDWETDYPENQSFNDVYLKLQIFDEIQKELDSSNTNNATHFEIFKGKKMKCSESVKDDLMYDCCYKFDGFAEKLKIAHCNADEMALSEMRSKGLCHYVGKKDGEFLGLWKSREERVFCCFPTKLSRIFQEQGREQLGISWGDAKEPNCRGLTSDEISKIDFVKLDLSELFEDVEKKMKGSDKKVQNFADKLAEKLKNLE